jgi:hypothetical protein
MDIEKEEKAYKYHVDFIAKETELDIEIIKRVLEADEKYLNLVISQFNEKDND